MKKIWCDRCGTEITGDEAISNDTLSFGEVDPFTGLPNYSLCYSCKKGLVKAIDSYIIEGQKTAKKKIETKKKIKRKPVNWLYERFKRKRKS